MLGGASTRARVPARLAPPGSGVADPFARSAGMPVSVAGSSPSEAAAICDLLDAQQHDRDVVAPARLVRRRDQRLAGVAQLPVGEQDLGDQRLGDHRREAVAAQQVHVAVASPVGAGVDLDLRLRAQRARDDRALRMLDGLLGRELALADQLVDERMVVGQAQQLAVAQAVGAAVADVRDRHLLGADVDGRERRAHARVLGARLGELVDADVRRVRARGEAALGVGRVVEAVLEGLDREPRGDLARLRAAHAVGHHEQRRAREHRVLVGAALAAGVGAHVLLGDAQHRVSPPRTRIRCRRCARGRPGAAAWVSPAAPR